MHVFSLQLFYHIITGLHFVSELFFYFSDHLRITLKIKNNNSKEANNFYQYSIRYNNPEDVRSTLLIPVSQGVISLVHAFLELSQPITISSIGSNPGLGFCNRLEVVAWTAGGCVRTHLPAFDKRKYFKNIIVDIVININFIINIK